jgi:uncharacterized protein (TIGR02145 family)
MKKIIRSLGVILFIILIHSCEKDDKKPIKDGDNNIYTSVKIGTQEWLIENLRTTKYNDGTSIPHVTNAAAWKNLSTPAYCWYNNDAAISQNDVSITYGDIYGAMYNWEAVNTDKLCPLGWHVPTDAEWTTLTNYLGGESIAGGKLKEAGTIHWNNPNTEATNETIFTALPGGIRIDDGTFDKVEQIGFWWSSTTSEEIYNAWGYSMWYSASYNHRASVRKKWGISVRCLKD